jgi:lysophospholipase L1-like esterase
LLTLPLPPFRRIKWSPEVKVSLKFALFFLLALFFAGVKATGQKAIFYLNENDRVVFFGDSITEQAFYTNFIETYAVTRFPQRNVTFINSGWSGDRIYGGGGGTADDRLSRDVFAFKPTIVTMMFGMNDGCYMEFNADCFKAFKDGYEHDLKSIKAELPQTRLTLLQPSPFDDWTDSHAWRLAPPIKGGYNTVIVRFGQYVNELAGQNQMNSADVNAPLVEIIKKAQNADRALAQNIVPDRIHPSAAGGWIMASAVLRSWNAPALVSVVEVDAATAKVVTEDGTKISELTTDRQLSWTQLDQALPLPLDLGDKTMALVLDLSDVVATLDRETLKVSHLKSGRYTLKIDGGEIGSFTGEELGRGIDLARMKTPMLAQSMAVHALTEAHNRVHFVRWREVQVPFVADGLSDASKAISALDALETELVRRQHAAAQPKPHHYELIPQA